MISHQELKKREFTKAFMGYSPAEVEDYVAFVLSRYNELSLAYNELERKYNAALSELEMAGSEEAVVTSTIRNAQKMAEEIVNEANEKASVVKGAVSESCNKILDVYRSKVAAERDKLAECEEAVISFKNALYDAYKKHIEMIDNIMPDEEPTPYYTDDELEEKAVEIANNRIEKVLGTDDENGAEPDAEASSENLGK